MNKIIIAQTAKTMTSKEMSELTEKRHDSVKRTIDTLAEKGTISHPQIVDGENGVVEKLYLIEERDSYIVVAQLSPEFTARIVDRWQELEKQAKPAMPLTYIEALEQLIIKEREKEAIAIERDHAVSTKAEIGTRREATAMNTASQAAKKVQTLEIELDRSRQYATIKRMEMLYHGQSFKWRLLKSAAGEMSIPPIDVFDQNYGTVKAYHADVWREAYALSINPVLESA
jgi:phage regulator Rha-like protein